MSTVFHIAHNIITSVTQAEVPLKWILLKY